eukprot:gene10141-12439_t
MGSKLNKQIRFIGEPINYSSYIIDNGRIYYGFERDVNRLGGTSSQNIQDLNGGEGEVFQNRTLTEGFFTALFTNIGDKQLSISLIDYKMGLQTIGITQRVLTVNTTGIKRLHLEFNPDRRDKGLYREFESSNRELLKLIIDSGKTVGHLDTLEITAPPFEEAYVTMLLEFIEAHRSTLKKLLLRINADTRPEVIGGEWGIFRHRLLRSELVKECLTAIHCLKSITEYDIDRILKSFKRLECFSFDIEKPKGYSFPQPLEIQQTYMDSLPPNLNHIQCSNEDYELAFSLCPQIKYFYNSDYNEYYKTYPIQSNLDSSMESIVDTIHLYDFSRNPPNHLKRLTTSASSLSIYVPYGDEYKLPELKKEYGNSLRTFIENSKTLEFLKLSWGNDIDPFQLFLSLEKNQSLKSLELNLKDDEYEQLTYFLNERITSLNITVTDLNRSVLEVLGNSKTLEKLCIDIKLDIESEPLRIPSGSLPKESLKVLSIMYHGLQNLLFPMPHSIFDQLLEIGSIGSSVETLRLDFEIFKSQQRKGIQLIPDSVKKLQIISSCCTGGSKYAYLPFATLDPVELVPDICGIPESVTELELLLPPDCKIRPHFIPSSVEKLILETPGPLDEIGVIPNSVKDLFLYLDPQQVISPGWIPNQVKTLQIKSDMNRNYQCQIEPGVIPKSVTTFKGNIKKPMLRDPDILSPRIEYLYCLEGWSLKTRVPQFLTYLECSFLRITISLSLPPTLKTLKLLSSVIKVQVGSLPESLTRIQFLKRLQCPLVKGTLPQSLKTLEFMQGISADTTFPVIPNGVTSFALSYCNILENNHNIPLNSLPDSIESILLTNNPNYTQSFERGILPNNLKSLVIINCPYIFHQVTQNNQECFIPPTLEILDISNTNYYSFDGNYYNQLIHKILSSPTCPNRLMLIIERLYRFINLDSNDSYIYHKSILNEGFCLKSSILKGKFYKNH